MMTSHSLIRLVSFTAASALLCAACAGTQNAGELAGERKVRYACSQGEDVEMRFYTGREMAVLERGGNAVQLHQQPSGSGFVYTNGPTTVRGQGDEITVEIGRMVPLKCQAR